MAKLKVEIVTPVHNRRETTLQCLRSLARIDKTDLETHIFVVDDGSSDGTSEAIKREFPDVQIIRGDGTLFYCGGTNRGIEAALEKNPDFVLTINDDAVFHEKFLQHLIETARTNPRSIVGALLLLWSEPHRVFQVDFKWNTLAGGWLQPKSMTAFDFPKTAFEVEGMAGNCVLFPAAAIRECGLMDAEKFPHNWGDIQYVVRMRKNGWRLLVEPKSYVWCEPNTNPKPLHQSTPREIFHNLFRSRKHPMNLKRQFLAHWDCAPTKTRALLGFWMYLLMLSMKSIKLITKSH